MRHRVGALVAGTFIGMVVLNEAAASPTQGSFDIKMPCDHPERSTEANGNLSLTCSGGDTSFSFMADVADTEATPDALYEKIAANIVDAMHGKLRSSAPVTVNGLRGRDVLIEISGNVVRIREFVAGGMLYVLTYVGSSDTENDKAVLDFLGSLRTK